MTLSHLEPMAARPTSWVDYETELKQYRESQRATSAPEAGLDANLQGDRDVKAGVSRLLDFLAAKKRQKKKEPRPHLHKALAVYRQVAGQLQDAPQDTDQCLDVRI